MSDKIHVSNLILHAHHGVFTEEKALGQKFELDIICTLDSRPFAGKDDYSCAVCYGSLCQIAEDVSNAGPYALIEKLGHEIALSILKHHESIESATVIIRKPSAPVPQIVSYMGVEITRDRTDIAT